MSNPTLNILLKDYEKKRYLADLTFEKQKQDFYNSNPKLLELNNELGKLALCISKAVLTNNIELEHKLRTDFENLKKEKDTILSLVDIPKRSYLPNI